MVEFQGYLLACPATSVGYRKFSSWEGMKRVHPTHPSGSDIPKRKIYGRLKLPMAFYLRFTKGKQVALQTLYIELSHLCRKFNRIEGAGIEKFGRLSR
jgi:hypothetical protein